jgi:8-oxo-dGTP diphosphatase
MVGLLESFPIKAIYSSPYLRCLQTVEPLARAHRLAVKSSASLAEGHGLDGLNQFLSDTKLDGAVLSTHGDIVWELVEDLVGRHVIRAGDGGFEKGSTWIVQTSDGVIAKARYLAAP